MPNRDPTHPLITILYERDVDGRFHLVGRCKGGRQFMAFVTGAYPSDLETGAQEFPGPDEGNRNQGWYGVMHLFDLDGNHLETQARFGGTSADKTSRRSAPINSWNRRLSRWAISASAISGCVPFGI
jgi:hypothetical protein